MLFSSRLRNCKRSASAARRRTATVLGSALVLTICIGSARADKPPLIPGLYVGEPVYITVVNPIVVGVDQKAIARHAANPIYFVEGQPHVLSTIPGASPIQPLLGYPHGRHLERPRRVHRSIPVRG